MMGLRNRAELAPPVADEFDHLFADLGVRLTNEHDDEGRHTAYEDYIPEWLAFATMPVIADGTVKGRWARRGTEIIFRLELLIGPSSTMGSGPWAFSLPVRPVEANNVFQVAMIDSSAGLVYGGTARNPTGNNPEGRLTRANYVTGAFVAAAVPFTWAKDDTFIMQGTYEGIEE